MKGSEKKGGRNKRSFNPTLAISQVYRMGFSLVDFQPVFCLYSFIFSDEVLACLTSAHQPFTSVFYSVFWGGRCGKNYLSRLLYCRHDFVI